MAVLEHSETGPLILGITCLKELCRQTNACTSLEYEPSRIMGISQLLVGIALPSLSLGSCFLYSL